MMENRNIKEAEKMMGGGGGRGIGTSSSLS
jgi:hypothetical protein